LHSTDSNFGKYARERIAAIFEVDPKYVACFAQTDWNPADVAAANKGTLHRERRWTAKEAGGDFEGPGLLVRRGPFGKADTAGGSK
jgi:hypothetical protein